MDNCAGLRQSGPSGCGCGQKLKCLFFCCCTRLLTRVVCFFLANISLWNAAHDDTIPDPDVKKTRIQGLHNTGWLWTVGDHTTGKK
jgi:hypothetical protein